MRKLFAAVAGFVLATNLLLPVPAAEKANLEFIRISPDKRGFVLAKSGAEFRPWGFNYDHDRHNRLLESYWKMEWKTVADDFAEMKQLGANTVRIHLQIASFMESPDKLHQGALTQLAHLLKLAEKTELYLDITGLGCYERKSVPRWFNELDEAQRWDVQARFWEAVAQTCRNSPAVFCYDLMNEPVLSNDGKNPDWTPGEFGGFNFVQRLTLDPAGRTRAQIANAWVKRMTAAIRKHDKRHLLTVGAIPWALTFPNAKPLFYSTDVSVTLDFVSLHFYPKGGEVAKALKALTVYDIGKPIVIEELFPLHCSVKELEEFIDGSQPLASGWIGFYWGKTIAEYGEGNAGIAGAVTRDWLKFFQRKTPEILRATAEKSRAH